MTRSAPLLVAAALFGSVGGTALAAQANSEAAGFGVLNCIASSTACAVICPPRTLSSWLSGQDCKPRCLTIRLRRECGTAHRAEKGGGDQQWC